MASDLTIYELLKEKSGGVYKRSNRLMYYSPELSDVVRYGIALCKQYKTRYIVRRRDYTLVDTVYHFDGQSSMYAIVYDKDTDACRFEDL